MSVHVEGTCLIGGWAARQGGPRWSCLAVSCLGCSAVAILGSPVYSPVYTASDCRGLYQAARAGAAGQSSSTTGSGAQVAGLLLQYRVPRRALNSPRS